MTFRIRSSGYDAKFGMNAAAAMNLGSQTPIPALYENWFGLNILFPGA